MATKTMKKTLTKKSATDEKTMKKTLTKKSASPKNTMTKTLKKNTSAEKGSKAKSATASAKRASTVGKAVTNGALGLTAAPVVKAKPSKKASTSSAVKKAGNTAKTKANTVVKGVMRNSGISVGGTKRPIPSRESAWDKDMRTLITRNGVRQQGSVAPGGVPQKSKTARSDKYGTANKAKKKLY